MMKKKVFLVSLGCDKNLVDSEIMLGMLEEKGFVFTDDESEADVVIVNTCCFIGDAKEESINTILEMAELKKNGSVSALIVTGCLAQRYQEEIRKEIEEVDAVIGTTAISELPTVLEEVFAGRAKDHYQSLDREPLTDRKRIVTTGGHFAYLKIAEGCDKRCTYCIIPKVRGPYRSVPTESLLREAEALAAQGVKELILVAQETTVYGQDIYGHKALPELLRGLCQIEGLRWIRVMYCYPEEIDDALIQVIREEEKICHYLDIPIQHASDAILKRMGRRTNKNELIHIIHKLRQEIPDICLRTTLITGFPGETKQDHEELMEFVEEMAFDRLGVFAYSQEEDTPAADMPEQIPDELKQERLDELMTLQQEIAFDAAADMEGRIVDAMIEGHVADEDVYVARTYKDAPDVDGFLFVRTDRELMTGEFVRVKITGANGYDLMGELEDESAE